ncbi:MAG: CDP-glucose 4,6-dehydratase [bacterium]
MEIKHGFNGFFHGKKIIITGDTGFKGSWLAIWLLEMGAEVYGYALPAKTGKDNYVVTQLENRIQHQDGDIRNEKALKDFFKKVKPDIALHLAAQPLVLESYNEPRYTFETNILGTVNFFEAVRETPEVKAAINVTTDKCYQNNEWVWGYRENDQMGGNDPYSASKGCSELVTNAYIQSFFKNSHYNIASARAGNVIGAGDWAGNRLIPDIFRAYQNNEKLTIRNPEATRPWQHVLEPLSGYLLLAKKLYENGEFTGGWNFGPRDEMNYSVKSLFEKINKHINTDNVAFGNPVKQPHEATLLKLDISKALTYLGWRPVLNFQETIDYTVEGYLADIKDNDSYKNRLETIQKYTEKANRFVDYLK